MEIRSLFCSVRTGSLRTKWLYVLNLNLTASCRCLSVTTELRSPVDLDDLPELLPGWHRTAARSFCRGFGRCCSATGGWMRRTGSFWTVIWTDPGPGPASCLRSEARTRVERIKTCPVSELQEDWSRLVSPDKARNLSELESGWGSIVTITLVKV